VAQLILSEPKEIARMRPAVIIAEHRLGFVMTNAGIKISNVSQESGECVLLRPEDPDQSCRQLREDIKTHTGARVAVIIIDSHRRALRNGTVAAYGQLVKAVVVLRPNVPVTAEELKAYSKQRLAEYEVPRIISFVPSLPIGPTGKILKRALS